MATTREEYLIKMLDSILDDNERHGTTLSSKKLQGAVSIVIVEEEKYAKHNANNVTMDTLFHSPITINTQKKDTNVTN